jgi:hypothetical protein
MAVLRGKEDVDLTCNIEIVRSACKAGVNHWSTGRREWAGAIRHDCHAPNRTRSGRRIVKAEDPHGQSEFGCQFLDRAGTPTGQHRIETTSPRLRGDKMPRIAVGAVNHPLCAAGHNRLIHFALRALGYVVRSKSKGITGFEIEAGVVPMTGQDAVLNAAALERESHVRRPIIEGEDVPAVVNDKDQNFAVST